MELKIIRTTSKQTGIRGCASFDRQIAMLFNLSKNSAARSLYMLCCIMLCAFLATAHAQNGDPPALDLSGYEDVLAPADEEQSDFLLSWNWGDRPPKKLSESLFMNAWHGGSRQFYPDAVENMDLIWVCQEKTIVDGLEWAGISGGGIEALKGLHAQAMHYSPVVDIDQALQGEFTPFNDGAHGEDPSGAAFGFRTRHTDGGREWIDNLYRYSLRAQDFSNASGDVRVLADPWPNDELFFVGEFSGSQFDDYNGRRMHLSINLRRLNDDPLLDDETVILRIRAPFITRDNNTGDIRFLKAPHPTLFQSQNHNNRGKVYPMADGETSEIEIRWGMLPTLSSGDPDVTITAYFELPFQSVNPSMRDRPLNIPIGVDPNDKLSSLNIEVDYNPVADIAVSWLRFETPHSQKLFRGDYDNLFRSIITDDLDALRQHNDATGDNARVFRFYGFDEARRSQWWALRYFNQLVKGRIASELGTTSTVRRNPELSRYYDKMYHYMVEPKESWGIGDIPLTQTASPPYILQGGSGDDVPSLDYELDFTHEDQPVGDDNLQTHFETWMRFNPDSQDPNSQPNKRWMYPPISDANAYNNFIRATGVGTRGSVQGFFENSLVMNYINNSNFLFNDKPWWMQMWIFSHWFGEVGRATPVSVRNHRPKTGEEIRLLMWNALLLGAKGFVHYIGGTGHMNPDPNTKHNVKAGFVNTYNLPPGWGLGLLRNPNIGGDFLLLEPGQSDNAGILNRIGSANYDDIKNGLLSDNANTGLLNNKLYIGQQSVRVEVYDIHRWIEGISGIGAYESVGDLLMDLRLGAWYDLGFRDKSTDWGEVAKSPEHLSRLQTLVDLSNIEADFFNNNLNGIDDRVTDNGVTFRTTEDRFFSVSYLENINENPAEVVYFGVLNRLTNPTVQSADPPSNSNPFQLHPDNTPPLDPVYFYSTEEFRDEWMNNANVNQYSQAGSRTIRIPFSHSGPIRIQELGSTQTFTLNPGELFEIDFLPGEGKLFRIELQPDGSSCCDFATIDIQAADASCCSDFTIDIEGGGCPIFAVEIVADDLSFSNVNWAGNTPDETIVQSKSTLFRRATAFTPGLITGSLCRTNSRKPIIVRLLGQQGDVVCARSLDAPCLSECCDNLEARLVRVDDEQGDCCWLAQIRFNSPICHELDVFGIDIVQVDNNAGTSIQESFPYPESQAIWFGDGETWITVGQICQAEVNGEFDIVLRPQDQNADPFCSRTVRPECEAESCCPVATARLEADPGAEGCCRYNVFVQQDINDDCVVYGIRLVNATAHVDIDINSIYDTGEDVSVVLINELLVGTVCLIDPCDPVFNNCPYFTADIHVQYLDKNGKPMCEDILTAGCGPQPPGNQKQAGDELRVQSELSPLLELAPNPAGNEVSLMYRLSGIAEIRIEILNSLGQVLRLVEQSKKGPGEYRYSFDSSQLSPGAYFVRLSDGNSSVAVPLMIVR